MSEKNGYVHPEVLVDTEWVEAHLNDPKVRFIEVDVDTAAYANEGHIPGAAGFNWQKDLQDQLIRALRDYILSQLGQGYISLVDVRSPGEYSGELLAPANLPQEGAQRGGHIPGAANIPWSMAVREDGTFKSADELRSIYKNKGITSDKEVIAYCRIGERSSHSWFVLHYLLGYPKVRNYDGSWTEWGSLIGAPIER